MNPNRNCSRLLRRSRRSRNRRVIPHDPALQDRRDRRRDAILDRLIVLGGREAEELAYEYGDLVYGETLESFGELPPAPMPPETPPGGANG